VRQAQHIVDEPNAVDASSSRSSFVTEPAAFVLPEPTGNDASSFEPLASSSETSNVVSPETAEHSPVKSPRADVAAPAPKTTPQSNVQATNRAQHGIYYFGDNSTRTTLSQMPRRTPIQPGAAPAPRQRAKPFQTIEHEPTVSPYLNLYRNDEDTESAPNYYAFVRPQMEQLESSRRQQMEILRLQRQMQNASSTVVRPQQRSAAVPNSGTAARYMDTAQFYGAWQR
jgi:hypothetical protein